MDRNYKREAEGGKQNMKLNITIFFILFIGLCGMGVFSPDYDGYLFESLGILITATSLGIVFGLE